MAESKYQIQYDSSSKTITVSGKDRVTVYIKRDGDHYLFCENEYLTSWRLKLFEFHSLCGFTASMLMRDWRPKNTKSAQYIKKWAITQCSKAVSKGLKAAWLEMLSEIDPKYVKLHKALFATSGRMNAPLAFSKLSDQNISDIINYRAAAYAYSSQEYYTGAEWQMFMHPDYHKNSSVRKTLHNIPGRIPINLISSFQHIDFKRPIYDRLELLANLVVANGNDIFKHQNLIHHATNKDLRKAIQLYWESTGENHNFNKVGPIITAINYIVDYNHNYRGNVIGLARRSINWHRELGIGNLSTNEKFPRDQKVALPPIDLPVNPNITFLSTCGEIYDRGKQEKHCVGTYDERAVAGHSFLFAIQRGQQRATAEIDSDGRIKQIQGPCNTHNAACSWGRKYLNDWLKAWPQTQHQNPLPAFEELPF